MPRLSAERRAAARTIEAARNVLNVKLVSITMAIVADESLDYATRLTIVQNVTGYRGISSLVASRELEEMSRTSRTPYYGDAANAYFKFAQAVELEA